MAEDIPTLGVGMVGHAFMGAAHSQAWRTAGRVFDLPLDPVMAALCGRDRDRTAAAARRLGWAAVETDWKELVRREDVALVDICTPGDSHAEIAIAALEAGKHVLCEKPLANTVEEAVAMTAAAERAPAQGVRAMVGFNYRRVPALALARRLIADGRLGVIRHVRAAYLQDWLADPGFPLTWRLQTGTGRVRRPRRPRRAHRGSGAVSHRPAPHRGVCAHRDLRQGAPAAGRRRGGDRYVDDAALFLGRFAGGAVATFEAIPVRHRTQERLRIEVNGSAGSVSFDLEALNVLQIPRPPRGQRHRRIPPDPRHRADPPLSGSLVAAGSPARLRAHLHPRGEGPGAGGRRRPRSGAVLRRRAAGAAGPRGGRTQRRRARAGKEFAQ